MSKTKIGIKGWLEVVQLHEHKLQSVNDTIELDKEKLMNLVKEKFR